MAVPQAHYLCDLPDQDWQQPFKTDVQMPDRVALIAKCRTLASQGADHEALVSFLRKEGCWKIDSIAVLREVLGIGTDRAKEIVHLSETWRDQREADDQLHETAARLKAGMETSTIEPVHIVMDYHDGPKSGIADFEGKPYHFDCEFDEQEDEFSDVYRLTPISAGTFQLARERQQIFVRWNAAFRAGETTIETHPALTKENLRYHEIQKAFVRAIKDAGNESFRVHAWFLRDRPVEWTAQQPMEAKWTVEWSEDSDLPRVRKLRHTLRNLRRAARVEIDIRSASDLQDSRNELLKLLERIDSLNGPVAEIAGNLKEVTQVIARQIIDAVLQKNMAYGHDIMDRRTSASLADEFISFFNADAKFFANVPEGFAKFQEGNASCYSFDPITSATFNAGVFIVDSVKSGFILIEDTD